MATQTEKPQMATLPKTTISAITVAVGAMLTPLAVSQEDIQAGVQALLDRVCGRGLKSLTDKRPLDRMLTMKEAAELLHRSTKTVRALIAAGKLKAVYCGADEARASGVTESSVRAFLEGRKAA